MAPTGSTKKKGNLKQGNLFSFFNKKPAGTAAKATKNPSKASNPSAAPKLANNADNASNDAIKNIQLGSRIEVYFPEDLEWYPATVEKKAHGSYASYYLRYDDGQNEMVDLCTERFRLAAPHKKRRITDDDDEEMELGDEPSEDGSVYNDEAAPDDEDMEDNQWMVSDSDDDMEVAGKRKTPNKRKSSSSESKTPSSSGKKSSSSLSQFSAGKVTITQHKASNITPTLESRSKSKQVTPEASTTLFSPPPVRKRKEAPLPFTPDALNEAGRHVHNHLAFLQHPRDSQGRSPDHCDYDPRTLKVNDSDWVKVTGKKMTDAAKQWWEIKARYFDTVLLFKTGKFYEMFHMDADIGVDHADLKYMKGHLAHAGFPEIAYGPMADKLVRAGYKVARVEQTETPEQLKERKKKARKGSAPKVVNREVCSVLTIGTRTFCYMDENAGVLETESVADRGIGPLLAIRETLVAVDESDPDEVHPVCEFGITLIDAVRGSVTIGEFADDAILSRMNTLLTAFCPSEVLIQGGVDGASPTLKSLLHSLKNTAQQNYHVEVVRPEESFPQSTALDPEVRKHLERGRAVHPWDVEETLAEMHRKGYFPRASKLQDSRSISRWPKVLRVAVDGNAELALSSLGAALFYLQRSMIDTEILSMGIVKAYIPPSSSIAPEQNLAKTNSLAVEHSRTENDNDEGLATEENQPSLDHLQTQELTHEHEIKHMELDGTTLHNLEILANLVNYTAAGSLWSKINFTKSPHGSRLLRAWLLRPLFRKADIERRSEAVQEFVSGGAASVLNEVRSVLGKVGDIERLLVRVHSMSGATCQDGNDEDRSHPNNRAVLYETAAYTKRKITDFANLLKGLREAIQIPELFLQTTPQSGLLRKLILSTADGGCFPVIGEELDWFFDKFDCARAKEGHFEPRKGTSAEYDESFETIDRIIRELDNYKQSMCSELPPAARKEWKYANTSPNSKDKYLIELPASINVPKNFIMQGKRGTGRKQVNKYRTSVVAQLVEDLETAYELQRESTARVLELIFARFDSKRNVWAAVTSATAMIDALGSLAQVASKPGYTRPNILECSPTDSPCLKVVQGRHPCVENTVSSTDFIPNDLTLGGSADAPSVLLLSGPNMGGKSTLLRQTCLITILAQIGCFVPADYCELTPLDRIFTRLGATDRILLNQSTFFVELAETAAALRGATRRSLAIFDELGRGTSTFDGTAIASAAVGHLVEKNQCISLFATHYHSLLDEWRTVSRVMLGHMECLVQDETENDESNITFLYTLGRGVCPKSFGINVARLAGLPSSVLQKAKFNSEKFEKGISDSALQGSSARSNDAVGDSVALEKIREGSWEDWMQLWENLQEMAIES